MIRVGTVSIAGRRISQVVTPPPSLSGFTAGLQRSCMQLRCSALRRWHVSWTARTRLSHRSVERFLFSGRGHHSPFGSPRSHRNASGRSRLDSTRPTAPRNWCFPTPGTSETQSESRQALSGAHTRTTQGSRARRVAWRSAWSNPEATEEGDQASRSSSGDKRPSMSRWSPHPKCVSRSARFRVGFWRWSPVSGF